MKTLIRIVLCLLLISLLSSCAYFNKEGPVDLRCPSCNYQIDHR